MSHDEDILTLNVDGEALEEEIECEREDETLLDAEIVRTTSDPGLPSKKEREEHEATHAQHRSWCIACVRGRDIAMKHHRRTDVGSGEGKLHTLVLYCCFPSRGSQEGITVVVVKETKTKAISTFMVPNKGARGYFVKAVADFMSGRGCSRAILKKRW